MKTTKENFLKVANNLHWDRDKIIDIICQFLKEEEMDVNFGHYLFKFMLGLNNSNQITDITQALETNMVGTVISTDKNTIVENFKKKLIKTVDSID